MQQVPTAAVPLREERVRRFVKIASAEVAQETLVIMVLDVLQSGFRDLVTVYNFSVRITEETKPQSQVSEPSAVAASYRPRRIEGAVLPRAVGVGRPQHILRSFELLRHLH